jgi:hypothetical protein
MEFGVIFFCGGLTFIDFYNTFDHLRTPTKYALFPDRATILQWGRAAIVPSRQASRLKVVEALRYE